MRRFPLQSTFMLATLAAVISYGLTAPTVSLGQDSQSTAPRYVRIGHYQCICQQGDFHANLATVVHGLELAADAGLAIVSFPESLLTGYYKDKQDAWTNSFAIDSPQMKQVLAKTSRFESLFMVGFNERRGEKLFNTIAVIENGKLLGRYSKAMPCYAYFEPGREFPVFEKNGLKFGIIICADGGYIEPARIVSLKGARVIFAPHFNFIANPVQHYQTVRSDHVARAVENGAYFLRGNNVERNSSIEGLAGFGHGYGDSYLLDPSGQIVAGAGLNDEALMIYNFDLEKTYYAKHNAKSRQSASQLFGILNDALESPQ